MLKSWKTRALATAGAVALAAPFAFTGGAMAVGGTAVLTTLTPDAGPPGQPIAINGSGCSSASGATNTVALFLRGPGTSSNLVSNAAGTVASNGTFTGSLTAPATALPGDTFAVTAQCSDVTGPGVLSNALTFTVSGGAILTTGAGGVTGTGVTGTSGTTTSPITPPVIPPTTTGVATPIPQQPTFTG